MIRVLKDIRVYLLLSVPFAWYLGAQLITSCCAGTHNQIHTDPQFSPYARKEIEKAVSAFHFPKSIGDYIKNNMASIISCQAHLDANKENSVRVLATPLLARINDQLVLLENSQLVPAYYYTAETLEKMPTITTNVLDNTNVLPDLTHFLAMQDPTLCDSFSIYFHHDQWIECTLKENEQFSIVCTKQQELSDLLIGYCTQLKKELEKKGQLHPGNHWIADVRFENQIILYTKTRGVHHG